jgi:hypothetical protein
MSDAQEARDALVERLADLSHEQWKGWYEWQRDQTGKVRQTSGELYDVRWARQAATSYPDLPADEQESDRIEARKVLEVLEANRDLIARALGLGQPTECIARITVDVESLRSAIDEQIAKALCGVLDGQVCDFGGKRSGLEPMEPKDAGVIRKAEALGSLVDPVEQNVFPPRPVEIPPGPPHGYPPDSVRRIGGSLVQKDDQAERPLDDRDGCD